MLIILYTDGIGYRQKQNLNFSVNPNYFLFGTAHTGYRGKGGGVPVADWYWEYGSHIEYTGHI